MLLDPTMSNPAAANNADLIRGAVRARALRHRRGGAAGHRGGLRARVPDGRAEPAGLHRRGRQPGGGADVPPARGGAHGFAECPVVGVDDEIDRFYVIDAEECAGF